MITRKAKHSRLTLVESAFCAGKFNYRVLFGTPKMIKSQDRQDYKRVYHYFAPGQIFALDLWRCNEYGTTEWEVYILQAARPQEIIVPVPQVSPGAKVLLEAHGKRQAQAALKELAEIQKRVDPSTLPAGRYLLTDFRLKADTRNRRQTV